MIFSHIIILPDPYSTAQSLGHLSIGSTGATKDMELSLFWALSYIDIPKNLHRQPPHHITI